MMCHFLLLLCGRSRESQRKRHEQTFDRLPSTFLLDYSHCVTQCSSDNLGAFSFPRAEREAAARFLRVPRSLLNDEHAACLNAAWRWSCCKSTEYARFLNCHLTAGKI